MQEQLDFTSPRWTYWQRRKWIDEAVIRKGLANDGTGVSAKVMKSVLHQINDHLGQNQDAWPSQHTMAGNTQISKRTIIRAIQALGRLSLVIVEPKRLPSGQDLNHYRIVWNELQVLEPSRRRQWHALLAGVTTEPGDVTTEPGDVTSPKLLTNKTLTDQEDSPPRKRRHRRVRTRADEPVPAAWHVVASVLEGLDMCDVTGAVTAAIRRELTPSHVIELVNRFERLRPHEPKATVGWLHRWIIGKSKPPPETHLSELAAAETVAAANSAKAAEHARRQRAEQIRHSVVLAHRRAGKSEDDIRQALRCELQRQGLAADASTY